MVGKLGLLALAVALLVPAAAQASPPVNQTPPSYLWWSNYRVGLHIGVDPGTWTGLPSISYQWQVSADGVSGWANETDAFAQGTIREPISSDACKYLRARVTATNADGASVAYTPVTPRIQPASGACTSCAGPSSLALTALSDLETGSYQGFPGGLYPGGSDSPPASYAAEGLSRAALVQALGGLGVPDPAGKIGLLSLGMSSASQEWSAFLSSWMASSLRNPAVTIVNGAQDGMTLDAIAYPTSIGYANFWNTVGSRLLSAGISGYQVQAVWLKDTIGEPATRAGTFPASAQLAKTYMRAVIDSAAGFFPNLQLVYVSTRIYSGYSTGIESLSPEPWAYEDGFAAKWLIEDRIASGVGPWIAWGPYLWANGVMPRSDGYPGTRTWACADFQADGVHPSASGVTKVSGALGDFFTTDPTARGWFLKP